MFDFDGNTCDEWNTQNQAKYPRRCLMRKPKGAKDRKPRKKREDKPAVPLPSPARDDGRTEPFRLNGRLKPENVARVKRADGDTNAAKLDECLDRLRELEGAQRSERDFLCGDSELFEVIE